MANCEINGLAVMRARIHRPRTCNWVAEVVVDAQDASGLSPGAAATLTTDGGFLSFVGTVLPGRSDAYAQNVTLRVGGGSAGFANLCRPRFYSSSAVQKALADILTDAKSALSATAQQSAISKPLPFWTLAQQPAGQALSLLADFVGGGCVWRVLADGTVFFGVDGFQATALVDYELVDYLPLEAIQVIASEQPDINPGESLSGRNVSDVEHLIDADGSRVKIFFEP